MEDKSKIYVNVMNFTFMVFIERSGSRVKYCLTASGCHSLCTDAFRSYECISMNINLHLSNNEKVLGVYIDENFIWNR